MRRARLAVPLVLALLAGCGGSDEPPPVVVTCGSTASSGPLAVTPPAGYTCGTATWPTNNVYTFTAAANAQHTVTLATTAGDADLWVWVQGGSLVGSSINVPPLVDAVTFMAASGTTYEVEVEDASFTSSSSTYGVMVTSP